jgi:hypothetical protein
MVGVTDPGISGAISEFILAAAHVDKNNKGHNYIIGLGDYTGGDLVFTDKKSYLLWSGFENYA